MDRNRLARARTYRARHLAFAAFIDSQMNAAADRLAMCGNGARHNASVQFADLFFPASNGCGCCWFYRGVAIGGGCGLAISLVAMTWGGHPTIVTDIATGVVLLAAHIAPAGSFIFAQLTRIFTGGSYEL